MTINIGILVEWGLKQKSKIKGRYESGFGSMSYPEYFGPDDFVSGGVYRIGSEKYKEPDNIEWRIGVVSETNAISINNARALEMVVEEKWKGITRKVRRTYSYYKMKIVERLR